MDNKKLPTITDPTLNPQNAMERGYRYITDINDPYKSVQELVELAEKAGYIFGATNGKRGKIGLYKKER